MSSASDELSGSFIHDSAVVTDLNRITVVTSDGRHAYRRAFGWRWCFPFLLRYLR